MNQTELFAVAQPLPTGLVYQTDFIGVEEERELLDRIRALPFRQARFQQYTARRRVVRFGEGDYLESAPDQPTDFERIEFPDFLLALRAKVAAWIGVPAEAFVHALTTEYAPGTPIGWHRDAPHFEIVAGISLHSACRMKFRPMDAPTRANTVSIELQPRSLYVMRDEIRWRWHHHIPPVKETRYSVTLRTLASAPPPGIRRRAGAMPTSR